MKTSDKQLQYLCFYGHPLKLLTQVQSLIIFKKAFDIPFAMCKTSTSTIKSDTKCNVILIKSDKWSNSTFAEIFFLDILRLTTFC